MRRSLATGFTVLVAALLSLVLAVPANAADPVDWWTQTAKSGGSQYHWGFDYWKNITGGTPAGPASTYPKPSVPVSGSINPSYTGGQYYLNQYRTRVPNPVNTPLTGKIIEPGKSIVRVPSTITTAPRFSTAVGLGMSRLWPGIGLGLGGTSLPPGNWKELSLAQGVPQACIDNVKSCDRASLDKMMGVTQCGLKGTCASIGAVGETGETDAQKWFKDNVAPLLDNVWCQITASCVNNEPSDQHNTAVLSKGCYTEFGVEPRADNNITIHKRTTVITAKPTNTVQGVYYDAVCSDANQALPYVTNTTGYEVVCVDALGHTATSAGSPFGRKSVVTASYFNADGTNKEGMCPGGPSGVQPVKILKIRFWNNSTQDQAYYNSDGTGRYSMPRYSEWLNPDASLSAVEDTKITTDWDCTDVLGKVWSYTKTLTGTAAAVTPDCPAGSDLSRHEIKASTPNQNSQTIDSGTGNTAEMSKYPNCSGTGCTIDIFVDGTRCTVARQECQNWPAVNSTQPSRVKCMWGSYTVPTSDCYAISNGYKAETGVIYDPKSGTWVAPDAYGNPVASNPEPWNQLNPQPTPGSSPSTGTTTGTSPSTPGFPSTGTSPSDGCVSPAWSWNPVEWVKNPVVCALKDAFVPKTDLAARNAALSDVLLDKPPMNWLTPTFTGPGGGGCPNWTVTIPGVMSENVVCNSSFTAAIVGARYPMFAIVSAAMVWPLIRSIWYAAIPVLRVSPGGHK